MITPSPASAPLTKRRVDALKPRGAIYDVFDAVLRGFSVRVHPSGRKVYRLKYLAGGRQRVATIGEHGPWATEKARTHAQVLRGQIAAGLDPAAQAAAAAAAQALNAARDINVAQLIERWLIEGRDAAPNKRTSSWAHDASRLRRHIAPLLGDMPLSRLRRADIEAAQRAIAAGATAADIKTGRRGRAIVRGGPAARGAIVSLSACLAWAVSQELVNVNPAAKVEKLAASKRERFLSNAETAALLDAIAIMQREGSLHGTFADALRLLMLTGARKSEITRLSWEELDLERAVIRLPKARGKTGEKTIVLGAQAIALLASRTQVGHFVFPSPVDTSKPIVGLQKAWARVRDRAKLAGVRVHDLRHSFASFAAADGASLLMIAKALGHANIATTERYAHLADAPVRVVSDQVAERIMTAQAKEARRAESP